MKICIVTGGTGGHIYPALALAQVWKEQDPSLSVSFIGNDNRMEADLVPSMGYDFYPLHTAGLAGSVLDKARAVLLMLKAKKQAKKLLEKLQPDAVIGFGGYVSAPVLMAAEKLHIPVIMHEQNSIAGKANKLAMNGADAIVTCYEKVSESMPKNKIQLLGNPRATLAARAEPDEEYFASLGLKPDKKTILVVMGSLGSGSVNELMKEALKNLDPSLQVLYVCGKDNDQDLNLFPGQPDIHTVPYADTMKLYGKLDGMICRAGATTLAELTALGIPAILIPSPYVANNHQYYNAKILVDRHAAEMIEEKDLNPETLKKAISSAFLNEHNRRELAANARAMGKPDAAYDMIRLIQSVIDKKQAGR